MRQSTINQAGLLSAETVNYFSQLGWQAMLAEVNLTPKPGLVDQFNSGAHKDMSLLDFHRSAQAIAQHFPAFLTAGATTAQCPSQQILSLIRPIGLACEKSMYQATSGVNTHKGTIFSLGLVLTAVGRLIALKSIVSPFAIHQLVAEFCQGITHELKKSDISPTAGQRLYQEYGLTGARGEAERGYPLVTQLALPHYLQQLSEGKTQSVALLETLILLMAHNDDTNIVNRGGMQGLSWIKKTALTLLSAGGLTSEADFHKISTFDKHCINRNFSPGGSADLLILTWFLARLPYSGVKLQN
ncbi:triphosphoribosyl-dephospho-CoA synthase CitG [Moellerella wisconsensis]|uniref:triphosphoribosyl-dephospho-CoA synthase CitG n=2 Tax=Gammaproteobacteria TaxID=1236 RepID=UPI001F4DE6F7|nr:triphosphoribosyl-dephospho-CoA synthase CitG [Moellerella wisconsensis]UNH43617.1 triphosphoribosyl-dephospho-CoA synthase CitG [Moellerella wisconsensis]